MKQHAKTTTAIDVLFFAFSLSLEWVHIVEIVLVVYLEGTQTCNS